MVWKMDTGLTEFVSDAAAFIESYLANIDNTCIEYMNRLAQI